TLVFVRDSNDPAVNVGTSDHNSLYSAWTGFRGQLLENRLILSGGAFFVSERNYFVQAGIPPEPIVHRMSDYVRLEATARYRPSPDLPLWLRLAAVSHAPQVQESPLPGVSRQGTRVMLGL